MNNKYIFLISLLLIVLVYSIITVESFESNEVEIVISRYNEDLEWLKDKPFNEYNTIIYNKGKNEDFYKAPSITKIIPLENVGREAHTYFYHIINNYDNLADLTVFLPGSIQLQHKMAKANALFNKIPDSNTSIITCGGEKHKSLYDSQSEFKIDKYICRVMIKIKK